MYSKLAVCTTYFARKIIAYGLEYRVSVTGFEDHIPHADTSTHIASLQSAQWPT